MLCPPHMEGMERVVVGVDEVGRGALAGDLVVAAAAFVPGPLGEAARAVSRDSKAFASRHAREQAFPIIERGTIHAYAVRGPDDIDRLNIRGAVLDAFTQAALAVAALVGEGPFEVLWDGKDRPPSWVTPGVGGIDRAVVKGDATVPEISAASVLAKVVRDRHMVELAVAHPGYGWERNAGYGSPAHIEGIRTLGMSPVHRSWARKFLV
jgi:ribonuclease HII